MIQQIRLGIVAIFITSSVIVLSACSEAKSKEISSIEIIRIPVIVEPVVIGAINATYQTTASLESVQEVEVMARVSGIVTKIFVEEGDVVEMGQVLAQLDTDKLDLELQLESVKLNQLASELDRNKIIYAKDLLSSAVYDRVKYKFEAQKAVTNLVRLNLEFATIRAPISGVIALRHIKIGNLVSQNGSAFMLTDLTQLQAIIHIPESEKAEIKIGQQAAVIVAAEVHPFKGRIKRISPIVNKDSGTVRVTISLMDITTVLRPGMFSRVSVIYDTHLQTMLVPQAAIMLEDDEVSLFVVREGIAHKRVVTIGFRNAHYVEIIDGIDVTDMVIIMGQRNLKDESIVELIEKVAVL